MLSIVLQALDIPVFILNGFPCSHMRAPLLERMPPFEGIRAGTADGEKGGVAITNGLDNSPDSQSLLNDLSSPNNNNINSTNENNESVRKRAVEAHLIKFYYHLFYVHVS